MSASKHRIYFLLQRAAHRIRSISDELLLDELGITTAQTAALIVVEQINEATQRDIARELEQNESAVAATIARLERGGFVRKKKSKADGRAWTLTLTRKGQAALAESRQAFTKINSLLDSAIGEMGSAELAKTLTALSRL